MIVNNQLVIFDKTDHLLPKDNPGGKVYYKKVGKEIKKLYGVELVHAHCVSDEGWTSLGSEMVYEGEGELTASRRLLEGLKEKQKKNHWLLPPGSFDRAYIDHKFLNDWDDISYGFIIPPKKNMVCLKDALGMLDQAIEKGEAEKEGFYKGKTKYQDKIYKLYEVDDIEGWEGLKSRLRFILAERELSKEEIIELRKREEEKKDENEIGIIYNLKKIYEINDTKEWKSLESKIYFILAKIKELKKKRHQDEEEIGVVYDLKRGVKRLYVITSVHKLVMGTAGIFKGRKKRWDIEEIFNLAKNPKEKAIVADSKDRQGLLNVLTLFMLGVALFHLYCRFRRIDYEKMVIFDTMLLFFEEVKLGRLLKDKEEMGQRRKKCRRKEEMHRRLMILGGLGWSFYYSGAC